MREKRQSIRVSEYQRIRILMLCIFAALILCNFAALTLVWAGEPFTKTAYEEFFRYHDFDNWLDVLETISSQEVKCYEKSIGTETTSTMISDVSNNGSTKVNYKIKAGVATYSYIIKIKTQTSAGNKYEDWVDLSVK